MEIQRPNPTERDQVLAELGMLAETFGPVKPNLYNVEPSDAPDCGCEK